MRVRSRYPAPTAHSWNSYRFFCNGTSAYGSSGIAYVTSDGEYITDEGGSKSASCEGFLQSRFKTVEHGSWVCDFPSKVWILPESSCQYIRSNSVSVAPLVLTGDGGLVMAGLAKGKIPAQVGYYDRWLKAKPSMSTRANMAVFLYELRDFKRMFELLPKVHFSLSNWRELLRYGNNLHLNWNFGWKPFLKDIKSVFEGMSTFEKRLQDFIQKANSELLRHVTDPPVSTEGNSGWVTWYGNSNFKFKHSWKVDTTFRSTFNFRYSIPTYDYESLRWRAYLDTLGLAVTPGNVWAIIPWSFVIDWFANVGPFLRTFDQSWIEPYITLCQACDSRKSSVMYEIHGVWKQGTGLESNAYVGRLELTHYTRLAGIPEAVWDARANLDGDRLRLLASLLGSRII